MTPASDSAMGADPIDRRIAREAALWLMRLGEGAHDADTHAECARWRARSQMHEHAWQRAQRINTLFGQLPAELARGALARPDMSRRKALKTMAVLIAAGPLGWAGWRSAREQGWLAEYRTAAGERRAITLADGTRVHLNTGTAVDVSYGDPVLGGDTLVHLRAGEIYVEAAAPCAVRTRQGSVRARHAHFSVRQSDTQCLVDVTQGEISVQPALADMAGVAPHRMVAPARARLDAAGLHDLPAGAPNALPDWMRGVLHARDMRLDAFVTELARYRQGVLRCDPDVAALRLSGTFQLENIDGILRALPALLPVQVRTRTAYWVVVGPREQSA
ncbi:FecR domain-containing protein [Pseudomonadota bacterium AL_CKDN230030165-1A_HGKHYDSX7]